MGFAFLITKSKLSFQRLKSVLGMCVCALKGAKNVVLCCVCTGYSHLDWVAGHRLWSLKVVVVGGAAITDSAGLAIFVFLHQLQCFHREIISLLSRALKTSPCSQVPIPLYIVDIDNVFQLKNQPVQSNTASPISRQYVYVCLTMISLLPKLILTCFGLGCTWGVLFLS